jgi:O-glycosyl hydrolase
MFSLAACAAAKREPVTLRVDPAATYQTIEGWGATLGIVGVPFDEWAADPTPAAYDRLTVVDSIPEQLRAQMIEQTVSELGLTRFRLEVGPQIELTNDNADPRQTNDEAYRFRWQDHEIENWLLPLKQRIEQRHEKLVLYISYDLRSRLTPAWLLQPEEYAEMAVTTLRHFKQAYDIDADYWVVLNEPGNRRPGDPKLVAELIAATGARLHEAGFRTRMAGPEVVTPGQIPAYLEALQHNERALAAIGQLTYHLYWDPMNKAHRNEIRDWARKLGVTTAQTEWLEGKGLDAVEALHMDLTEADVSAWEQYTLCWNASPYNAGGGGDYFVIDEDNASFRMNTNAQLLRQYMKYIRPGDVRIGVSSPVRTISPVAFQRPDGRQTVVMINTSRRPEEIRLENLTPGDYKGSITLENGVGHTVPRQPLAPGGALALSIPARAVITLQAVP